MPTFEHPDTKHRISTTDQGERVDLLAAGYRETKAAKSSSTKGAATPKAAEAASTSTK